jgi:hypothetical protein
MQMELGNLSIWVTVSFHNKYSAPWIEYNIVIYISCFRFHLLAAIYSHVFHLFNDTSYLE